MEDEQKTNLEITGSNYPMQATPRPLEISSSQNERRLVPVDRSEFKIQVQIKKIIDMWSDRGSIYIDGASGGADDVEPRSQRFMQIGDLERLKLQMGEERKKSHGINDVELPLPEITASNHLVQAPEVPSSQNMRRIVPVVGRSGARVQTSWDHISFIASNPLV
ncbi:hypothetical protein QJS10_CPA09g01377 [Acorus calamus]|uniref:Uncharacterized protein n=1 Tax=Acorus calamus TaxID=4465 RepID=A0AAV9E317_ACOCL|nr:hypothetical protein QJS10_CPA09g01377 [Acorus calamus]